MLKKDPVPVYLVGMSKLNLVELTLSLIHIYVEHTRELASVTGMEIIASGGVSSMKDLESIYETGNISGAIIGKALYENRIDLRRAIQLFEQGE